MKTDEYFKTIHFLHGLWIDEIKEKLSKVKEMSLELDDDEDIGVRETVINFDNQTCINPWFDKVRLVKDKDYTGSEEEVLEFHIADGDGGWDDGTWLKANYLYMDVADDLLSKIDWGEEDY